MQMYNIGLELSFYDVTLLLSLYNLLESEYQITSDQEARTKHETLF